MTPAQERKLIIAAFAVVWLALAFEIGWRMT